jgi:hypothetical protein
MGVPWPHNWRTIVAGFVFTHPYPPDGTAVGLGAGGCENVADDGRSGMAGEAAGGDHGAEVGVDLGASFRAESVLTLRKITEGRSARSLSLLVASIRTSGCPAERNP